MTSYMGELCYSKEGVTLCWSQLIQVLTYKDMTHSFMRSNAHWRSSLVIPDTVWKLMSSSRLKRIVEEERE